jgi:acid phosphatase class B
MDFLSELRWRGMLQDVTPGLEDYLKTEKVTAYIREMVEKSTMPNYLKNEIIIIKIIIIKNGRFY